MQKLVRRGKQGHYILINGTIQQEAITILNIYALNIGTPSFIKQRIDRTGYNNCGRSQHSTLFNRQNIEEENQR
jgi:hypothetical protein